MRNRRIGIPTTPSKCKLKATAAATLLLVVQTAAAQTTAPAVEPNVTEADESAVRAPLLREGSQLVRVVGEVHLDEPTGAWTFVIDSEDGQSPNHKLTLMPGSLLDELERMIEATPEYSLVFEMTGTVYIYSDRNFLMPSHPPLLIDHREPQAEPLETDPPAVEMNEGEDSVQDIIRELDSSIGPVASRSSDGKNPTLGVNESPADGKLLREGTTLLSRRGRVRRTVGGSFIFVFDADAEGLGDPSMLLLPCMLLQRIELRLRSMGDDMPILLSGQVYTYHGRNYMLPTMYRIPREQTKITP